MNRHVEAEDGPDTYTAKIFRSTMACLDAAKNSLDISAINRCVDILTQSKKISFFGLGASSAVARDAQNKFFRFNIPVVSFDDIVMMRMSCINSSEGDVVVLISHTGRTKALVEIAALARENDATVIGMTAKDSPGPRVQPGAFSMDVPEDTDVYMPMASRIAQLALVDVATGFTLRRGMKFRENLKKVKEGLRESRFDTPALLLIISGFAPDCLNHRAWCSIEIQSQGHPDGLQISHATCLTGQYFKSYQLHIGVFHAKTYKDCNHTRSGDRSRRHPRGDHPRRCRHGADELLSRHS